MSCAVEHCTNLIPSSSKNFKQPAFSAKFAEIMSRKFSAYREFAINAGVNQGKKPQGRLARNRSPLADLRSPRYIFARCNFGQNCSRASPRRAFIRHSRMFTPLQIEASAKRQDTNRDLNCALLSRDDDDDDCRKSKVVVPTWQRGIDASCD